MWQKLKAYFGFAPGAAYTPIPTEHTAKHIIARVKRENMMPNLTAIQQRLDDYYQR